MNAPGTRSWDHNTSDNAHINTKDTIVAWYLEDPGKISDRIRCTLEHYRDVPRERFCLMYTKWYADKTYGEI